MAVNNLLGQVALIVENQKREAKLKGEGFNIFSILKAEYKENQTHSNFIGELLNPNGSHLMGRRFLVAFLSAIEHDSLDHQTTTVTLEKSIGKVHIDEQEPANSRGGRIDILLQDRNNSSLCIENKIHALDQKHQVVRYHNYNKGNNTVFYLTLEGKEPSKESACNLTPDEDYKVISYEKHIMDWLEECQRIAVDSPILRESINQYKILIKKLTGRMENRHNEQLIDSILTNFEAAKTVVDNITNARKRVCKQVFDTVFERLNEEYRNHPTLRVRQNNSVYDTYTQIFIFDNRLDKESTALYFFISSFSGDSPNNDYRLYLGILNPPPHNSDFAKPPNTLSFNNYIINEKQLGSYMGYEPSLADHRTIQKLYTDKAFMQGFIDHVVSEALDYVEEQYPELAAFIEENYNG